MEAKLYHKFKGQDLNEDLNLKQQKQQISKFIKRSVQSKNLAIFLGSGCSVPAIPLMSKTMGEILEDKKILETVKSFLDGKEVEVFKKYLENRKSCVEEDKCKIESLIKRLEAREISLIGDIKKRISNYKKYLDDFYGSFSDIESLLNWLQNGISYNPNDKDLIYAFKNIKEKFIATIPTQEAKEYNKNNSGVFEIYSNFYSRIFKPRSIESPKVSIFTTNYDLFNEKALEDNNIIYTTGFRLGLTKKFDINQFKYRQVDDTDRYKDRWQPISNEANLYKLHGSINWKTSPEGELCQVEDKPDSEAVVIYPTMLKHRETAQAPYSELFREFANTLQRKNTTLIVMGYGFPDEHINTIISQNLKNQDFTLIVFGDINEPKMKAFYDEHENSNIHLIGGKFNDKQKGHFFEVIVNEFLKYAPEASQQREDNDE